MALTDRAWTTSLFVIHAENPHELMKDDAYLTARHAHGPHTQHTPHTPHHTRTVHNTTNDLDGTKSGREGEGGREIFLSGLDTGHGARAGG